MAVIKHVYATSPFYGKVKKGDDLIRVNGKEIHDFLDYMYFSSELDTQEQLVEIAVRRGKRELSYSGDVREGDLRLEFENYLMDRQRSCKNKCIFCFIDQLPPGMRDTLYYRDDDFRLSLIYGNYVTLTNLSEEDIARICALRVSPLNISVHTTDPLLRVRMMKNPNAANLFPILQRFAAANINLRGQIVLCKDVNDGENLQKTMKDLKSLYPALMSVSIVPVGLTKFREGLEPLQPFAKEDAREVIRQVNEFGDFCKKELGTRIFYLADEFYLKAELPLPGYAYYEDFEQIENGVGMMMSFAQEFHDLMSSFPKTDKKIRISLATGVSIAPFFETVVAGLQKRIPNLDCNVYAIENEFFGKSITVAGLLTGQDIAKQLKGKDLGSHLLLSTVMLRGNTFLDGITTNRLSKELGVKIKKAGTTAEDFVRAVVACAERNTV